MSGSPMLISISLKGADVVLVESVIRAAREAAGNHWQGVEFGVPLFNREAMDDDDWAERRVADLKVGDEVRDYGEIIEIRTAANWRHNYEIELLVMFGERNRYLPVHARVDVLRPDDPASSIYTNGDSLNECRACSVGAHDECVILSRAFRERNERLLQDDPLWCCCGPPTVEMSPMTEPRISRSLQEALAVIISNLTEQAEAIDTISEALVVDNCVPASLADAADSARDAIDSIGRFLP